MAEQTYAEARGVGLVAAVMLAVAIIVALTFVWTGLTHRPPVAPGGAPAAAAPAEPAAAPAEPAAAPATP